MTTIWNLLLHFMSLLTSPKVKKSHILAGKQFILFKKRTQPNFSIPTLDFNEKFEKLVTKQDNIKIFF